MGRAKQEMTGNMRVKTRWRATNKKILVGFGICGFRIREDENGRMGMRVD